MTDTTIFPDEEWFAVTVAVSPLTTIDPASLLAAFEEALLQRDYFRNTLIEWDTTQKCLLVHLEDRGYSGKATADGIAREVAEVSAEILDTPEQPRILIIDVGQQG